MKSTINKLEDNTIELKIAVPWETVKKVKEEVLEAFVKEAELPGFRKGMAPKKLVEEKIDPDRLREEILKRILPQGYVEAVKEHKINPIINPKIHVDKLEDEKDWEFTALTCEAPQIELGDYKDKIKTVTAKSKIAVPGKEQTQVGFDEVVKILMETVKITIPAILIEGEVDRLLSQMLDEIKRLGLTLDQYLASTKRTIEDLRAEYAQKASNDLKLEFALQKIADEEKIFAEDKEVDEAITQAPNEAERQNLMTNKNLLAVIIRQQKTLDFLRNL